MFFLWLTSTSEDDVDVDPVSIASYFFNISERSDSQPHSTHTVLSAQFSATSLFTMSTTSNPIGIASETSTTSPNPHGLSTSVKVGIGVGVGPAGLVVILISLILIHRSMQKHGNGTTNQPGTQENHSDQVKAASQDASFVAHEMQSLPAELSAGKE
ncbi:hypothetical protein F5B22DRAFT_606490 [Xylaria bambusicola]|uniref:uncharacterized protein n=1 Tax=Xylaria bambusicola TaxID=326684 RepID=UPI00200732BB|nr:uncharacterized protein F5B22DRAFT_606490 [Xylaria bambusicola]KAI0516785.1 hypothetical protein F5B22DRAFT_606490 [Xylaria bambusicola]